MIMLHQAAQESILELGLGGSPLLICSCLFWSLKVTELTFKNANKSCISYCCVSIVSLCGFGGVDIVGFTTGQRDFVWVLPLGSVRRCG